MNTSRSNGSLIMPGFVGLLVGGFIGFLLRPSSFLVGQLSFETVISRGANLKGLDELLVSLAQRSFNTMAIWAIIGAIAGVAIGYFTPKRNRQTQTTGQNTLIYCTHCGEKLESDTLFCPECGEQVEKDSL